MHEATPWSGRSSTRQLPDEGQLHVLLVLYAQALYYGPTPVPEAVLKCSDLLADAPGTPTFEAGIATTLAGLRSMEGRFEQARELYAGSVAVYEEFGLRFRRAVRSIIGAQIEWLAGDLAAAETELRTGYSMLEEMGESGARSAVAAVLADVLSAQGDDAEAERFVRVTRESAAETDVWAQVLWRRALARTTARSGHATEAQASRAAPSSSPRGRMPSTCGQARSSRSERCSATRARSAVASVAMEEARTLYGRKGNLAALQLLTPTSGPAPVTFHSCDRHRTITGSKGGGRAAKHTGKSKESLQKALEEAYKEAMKGKPKGSGTTFRFKVGDMFVEERTRRATTSSSSPTRLSARAQKGPTDVRWVRRS